MTKMNIKELQIKVNSFIQQHNLQTDVATRMLDLVSEVGELAKELLKSTNYGKQATDLTDSFRSELGDVLFSLICIANSTNIDLQDCLNEVLQKYQQRFKDKGTIESRN